MPFVVEMTQHMGLWRAEQAAHFDEPLRRQ